MAAPDAGRRVGGGALMAAPAAALDNGRPVPSGGRLAAADFPRGAGRRLGLSVAWSPHERALVELAAKRLGVTKSEIVRRGALALAEAIAAGEDTPSGVSIRVADLAKMVQ